MIAADWHMYGRGSRPGTGSWSHTSGREAARWSRSGTAAATPGAASCGARGPCRHDNLLSVAAHDVHQMTWCCIQKLCTNSGEGQYGRVRPVKLYRKPLYVALSHMHQSLGIHIVRASKRLTTPRVVREGPAATTTFRQNPSRATVRDSVRVPPRLLEKKPLYAALSHLACILVRSGSRPRVVTDHTYQFVWRVGLSRCSGSFNGFSLRPEHSLEEGGLPGARGAVQEKACGG
jgi:hypothetical protein